MRSKTQLWFEENWRSFVVAIVICCVILIVVINSYIRMKFLTWINFNNIPIAESGLAILSFIGAVFAAIYAVAKFGQEGQMRRVQLLNKLIEDFKKEHAEQLFRKLERGSDFLVTKPDEDDLDALRHCSYVCYLYREGLVSEREFGFFKYQIEKILRNDAVYRYLSEYCEGADDEDVKVPYYSLVKYADSIGAWNSVIPISDSISKKGGKVYSLGQRSLKESEITEPIMIIRFSRLYRAGMSEEEVYELARGFWRVSVVNAMKVKYVLFVAEKIVRAVYKVNGWEDAFGKKIHDLGEVGDSNRYRIVGEQAEDNVRSKYLNRSTANLFTKGNINPVKYFNI